MLGLMPVSEFGDSSADWDALDASSYPVLVAFDATEQSVHQVAGMLRLADSGGNNFLGGKIFPEKITLTISSLDTTVGVLDVNAAAANDTARVDFWSCGSNSNVRRRWNSFDYSKCESDQCGIEDS